jgi:hypothetical protein
MRLCLSDALRDMDLSLEDEFRCKEKLKKLFFAQ